MSRATTASVAAAVLMLVVLALLAPWAVPGSIAAALDAVTGLLGLGTLAAFAALLALGMAIWQPQAPMGPPPMPGGEGGADGPPRLGADLDARLETIVAAEGRVTDAETGVREELRTLAVEVYRQTEGCDLATAERAVETGAWTEDPTAASFVGGEDAPETPLRVWFWDVLRSEGVFYGQVQRTLAAIDARRTGADGDAESPRPTDAEVAEP